MVGDAMVDRFVVGRVTRISPEAPVPVVRFEREYCRAGGAANVAQNLTALGARATLAEAAILANHAAGVVVGKFGPAALSSDDFRRVLEG